MGNLMFTRRFILTCTVVLALGVVWQPGRSAASIEDDATAMVQNLADRALVILGDEDMPRGPREKQLRKLLLDNFNVRAIGRFVIGAYWRTASKERRAEFLKVFETYVVKTYTVQLAQFAGEKFKVLSAVPDKRGVLVTSQVVPPNRAPVDLKWRVRKSKTRGLQIVDVVVENISMALTQRQEFASVIQKRGGSLKGLIEALHEKNKQLEAKDRAKD